MADEGQKVFPDDYYVVDVEGAKKTILSMYEHVREGYRLAEDISPEKSFSKVVIAGMGGSGIAGDLLSYELLSTVQFPVQVVKAYEAPPHTDSNTLFIAVSYSGNTEETLSAYKMAVRKGAQAIVVCSGGKLAELARINKHPLVKLPVAMQPRMAVAYLFFPLLRILVNAGVLQDQEREVKELVEYLYKSDVTKSAIELSGKLFEHIPLVWADAYFFPVAYRWKTQFNENAKTPAFAHQFSELNHNELLAFTNRVAPFHVVVLSTDRYHRRVQKRISLTKDILQKKGVAVTEIHVKGGPLKQLFSAILLGDLTSYFLALRYETDPTPVVLIEQFKKDLGPFLI